MTAEPESTPAADSEEQSRWGPGRLVVLVALALGGALGIILYWGHVGKPWWEGDSDKKFWDYLELLIVPAAIAIGVAVVTAMQNARQRQTEARQRERERTAEQDLKERERKAQAAQRQQELDVENQRAQDAALQAYLDKMSELLIDKELHKKVGKYEPTRVTARARTLVTLTPLDGKRKRSIVQFLYEAHLINAENKPPDDATEFKPRLVGLSGADLKNANLRHLILEYAALDGAILENANLRDTWLSNIDLGGTYLSGANLRRAILRGANLKNADLQRKAELNLTGADLTGADLTGADLTGADLTGADLSDAVVTSAQLQSARSLQGATLPDGTVRD